MDTDLAAAPAIESVLSVETADKNFRAAADEYQAAFNALKNLVEAKMPEPILKQVIKRVSDADAACGDALKALIKVHKHGAVTAAYLDDGNAFINRLVNFASGNVDPLKGEHRRLTKGFFDEWNDSERAYASAGLRTIPSDDWLSSMPREGMVPYGLWHLILVQRDQDEAAVHHALIMKRRHKGLQVPGVDLKKLRRRMG